MGEELGLESQVSSSAYVYWIYSYKSLMLFLPKLYLRSYASAFGSHYVGYSRQPLSQCLDDICARHSGSYRRIATK